MSTENNNQDGAVTENDGGENEAETPSAEELTALRQKAEVADKLEKENASLKRDLKKAQKKEEAPKEEAPEKPQQSNEPDYAKLALLEARQVTNPDDQQIVLEEAKRLNLPLTDVLGMEHIKARLETNKNQRSSQEAMPDGKGRKGGPNKNEVDYYLAHPDEVPEDLELHTKVIDARMKKIENDGKFSSVPFIG